MSSLNETSGLSSDRQITDSTGVATYSPNNTSSDIARIVLTLMRTISPKKEEKEIYYSSTTSLLTRIN